MREGVVRVLEWAKTLGAVFRYETMLGTLPIAAEWQE